MLFYKWMDSWCFFFFLTATHQWLCVTLIFRLISIFYQKIWELEYFLPKILPKLDKYCKKNIICSGNILDLVFIEEEKTLSPAQHWQVATTHNKLWKRLMLERGFNCESIYWLGLCNKFNSVLQLKQNQFNSLIKIDKICMWFRVVVILKNLFLFRNISKYFFNLFITFEYQNNLKYKKIYLK